MWKIHVNHSLCLELTKTVVMWLLRLVISDRQSANTRAGLRGSASLVDLHGLCSGGLQGSRLRNRICYTIHA